MRIDIAIAFDNTTKACAALISRGAKLNVLEVNAHELKETTDLYRVRSLGITSQSAAVRYCRLCMFDIEFRTAVYLGVLAVVVFIFLVTLHLTFFDKQ